MHNHRLNLFSALPFIIKLSIHICCPQIREHFQPPIPNVRTIYWPGKKLSITLNAGRIVISVIFRVFPQFGPTTILIQCVHNLWFYGLQNFPSIKNYLNGLHEFLWVFFCLRDAFLKAIQNIVNDGLSYLIYYWNSVFSKIL